MASLFCVAIGVTVRISTEQRFIGCLKSSMQTECASGDDDRDMKPTLTAREEQLLLVRRGMTNAEIAHRMEVREQTVKNALAVLFQKCHARNRTELALTAVVRLKSTPVELDKVLRQYFRTLRLRNAVANLRPHFFLSDRVKRFSGRRERRSLGEL